VVVGVVGCMAVMAISQAACYGRATYVGGNLTPVTRELSLPSSR
jgi:hypothetical protein